MEKKKPGSYSSSITIQSNEKMNCCEQMAKLSSHHIPSHNSHAAVYKISKISTWIAALKWSNRSESNGGPYTQSTLTKQKLPFFFSLKLFMYLLNHSTWHPLHDLSAGQCLVLPSHSCEVALHQQKMILTSKVIYLTWPFTLTSDFVQSAFLSAPPNTYIHKM
jgi:hypothetical protein